MKSVLNHISATFFLLLFCNVLNGQDIFSVDNYIPHKEYSTVNDTLSLDYALELYIKASEQYEVGNYNRAITLGYQALKIRELNKDTIGCTYSYQNLASAWNKLGRIDGATLYGEKALYLALNYSTFDTLHVATLYDNLACTYSSASNYDNAISCEIEALVLRVHALGSFHEDVLRSLNNLSSIYFDSGDYEKADTCMEWALSVLDSLKTYSSPLGLSIALNRACHLMAKNDGTWIPYYHHFLVLKKMELLERLHKLDYNERWFYWDSNRKYFDFVFQHIDHEHLTDWTKLAVNSMLFSKQFILNNNTVLSDSMFVERFFCSNYSVLQERIDTGVLLVDFKMSHAYENNHLYALLNRKEWESPLIIDYGDVTNLTQLTDTIWNPIIKLGNVQKGETIYFSPDGFLNIMGIEYFTINGESLYEQYNVHRISSLINLPLVSDEAIKYIVLFGGLNFDAPYDNNEITNKKSYPTNASEWVADSNSIYRSNYDYLPGTREEIYSIQKEAIAKGGIDADLYEWNNGTESAFKRLSQRQTDVIHIASHAQYIPTFENKKRTDEDIDTINWEHAIIRESLSRAYILMTSGKNKLLGHKTPKGTDDGILTGNEIANMDLSSCKLIVLSGCQTAQGQISTDLVGGLAFACKMAGVKNIIMSLSLVDDRATSLFMSFFYKNLFSNNSIYKSFRLAQAQLKDYEENGIRPYSEKNYWGNFILLE